MERNNYRADNQNFRSRFSPRLNRVELQPLRLLIWPVVWSEIQCRRIDWWRTNRASRPSSDSRFRQSQIVSSFRASTNNADVSDRNGDRGIVRRRDIGGNHTVDGRHAQQRQVRDHLVLANETESGQIVVFSWNCENENRTIHVMPLTCGSSTAPVSRMSFQLWMSTKFENWSNKMGISVNILHNYTAITKTVAKTTIARRGIGCMTTMTS